MEYQKTGMGGGGELKQGLFGKAPPGGSKPCTYILIFTKMVPLSCTWRKIAPLSNTLRISQNNIVESFWFSCLKGCKLLCVSRCHFCQNLAGVQIVERERKMKRAKEREKKRGETFFLLFRSLYFSLALHYLNAWNRLLVTIQ